MYMHAYMCVSVYTFVYIHTHIKVANKNNQSKKDHQLETGGT